MGGPNGVSLIAWLLLAPISIFFTIEVVPEGRIEGYSVWAGYLVGLLGHLVTGVVLWSAKVFVLIDTKKKPKPILTLSSFAVAGLFRGASVAFLFDFFGITADADYIERMRSGAVLVVVWFAVSAVMVDGWKNYKATFLELSEKRDLQKTIRDEGLKKLQAEIDKLISQIKQTLEEALRIGSNLKDFHRAVDEFVRPLSHRIGSEATSIVLDSKPPKRQLKIGPVIQTALNSTPYNSSWTSLMAIIGTFSSRVWQFGWLAVIESVGMALVIWLSFFAARSLRLFGLWVPVVWFITGLLTSGCSSLITTGQVQLTPQLLYLSVNVFFPAAIVAFIGGFDRNAKQNLDLMRYVIAELKWETASLQQRSWVEQRRIGRFVHSELQSRIRAFALRMDLADQMPPDEEVLKLKLECERALSIGVKQQDFEAFMEDISELWLGVMETTFNSSPGALEALRSDGYASAAAIEVVREALSNAVKHGKARRVSVKLELEDAILGQLAISVTNDGLTPSETSPGFGLKAIADLSLKWELSSSTNQTILYSAIPIQLGRART